MVTSSQNGSLGKEEGGKVTSSLSKWFLATEFGFGDVWCGVVIAFMTLFVCTEILARLIFNYSFIGIVDIVSLCLVILTYAGLAAVQRNKAHIMMDLISTRLSGKLSGSILEIINLVLGMAASVFLFYAVTMITISLYRSGSVTMTVYWPFWPVALFMPIGCLLYITRLSIQMRQAVSKMRGLRQP